MRDFFKSCLEDLESLTGLRQLYFLQSDEDGKRKAEVCITGMLLAAADYPYIPQDAQQKIIREQMVKDQTYDALNSRMVHKWLGQASGKYYRETSHQVSEDAAPPAPPEVADKYIAKALAQLAEIRDSVREVPRLTPAQIVSEGREQRDPTLQGSVSNGYKPNHKYALQVAKLEEVSRRLGYDKIRDVGAFKHFDVEGHSILALTEVDALFIHSEVYQEQNQSA